MITNKLINTD